MTDEPRKNQPIIGYRFADGRPIHDGDCEFWSKRICTCGLLHKMMFDPPYPDWFDEEKAWHDSSLARVAP